MREYFKDGERVIEISGKEAERDRKIMRQILEKRKADFRQFMIADGTLKHRCFEVFEKGVKPSYIVKRLGLNRADKRANTIYRYYGWWEEVRGLKEVEEK
jgi:hypothetical protein